MALILPPRFYFGELLGPKNLVKGVLGNLFGVFWAFGPKKSFIMRPFAKNIICAKIDVNLGFGSKQPKGVKGITQDFKSRLGDW